MTVDPNGGDPLAFAEASAREAAALQARMEQLQDQLLTMARDDNIPEHVRTVLLTQVELLEERSARVAASWRWTHEQLRNEVTMALLEAGNRLAGESNTTAKALKFWTIVLAGATVVLAFATLALIFATLSA